MTVHSAATPASAAVMAAAVLAGWALARRSQAELGLPPRERRVLALAAFCGGFIGAKLPYLGSLPGTLWSAAFWLGNGRTILGGLVGGYLAVEAAKAWLGVTTKTGDAFAVPVAVAVGIGRLSCFCARCCYGTPTALPWGVDFGDGVPRHPTQLYETAFHLSMALVLWRLRSRGLLKRQLLKLYILSYLVYRFLTEFIRPEPRVAGPFTAYQLAALMLMPVFAGLWVLDAARPALAEAA
ncbi:MAG: prolipoprotein diacylglyceryl transferase [Elusimicrobia bacterium]|nr:prolipoprotein diacylglyceryl transferase [Elusimicrobiota bacterium]